MKAGGILKLKDGTTIRAIPNLVQIITGKDSCAGCYFSTGKGCSATNHNMDALACGSVFTEPKEAQVIYVEVKDGLIEKV